MISVNRIRTIKVDQVCLISDKAALPDLPLSEAEQQYVQAELDKRQSFISVNKLSHTIIVAHIKAEANVSMLNENIRLVGVKAAQMANHRKVSSIGISNHSGIEGAEMLAAEGAALSSYQFLKYKKEAKNLKNSLENIEVLTSTTSKKAVEHLNAIIEGVYLSRTLVNEPLSYLTAPQMSKEIKKMGKAAGFKVTVFDKKRIEKEKFNGLLAVNFGSIDPPTFNIMEWKPKKAKNKKTIVLVGKGVVYDTGGLSLKSSAGMEFMKCDMGGAAAVIGAMYVLAKSNMPYHVIGLVPATDNRPGGNAYVPGDVVKMRDGLTVEVLNTDAEGRMILADALSYAKNYDPEVVVEFSTLTGASARAVGPLAMAMMSTADRETTDAIIESGHATYERMVEFPLWKEYGDMLKSDIADIKNIGGATSGGITAGKFLENFTDYPWIHLDIAPTAWSKSPDGYRGKNGTGSGVRMVVDFIGKM